MEKGIPVKSVRRAIVALAMCLAVAMICLYGVSQKAYADSLATSGSGTVLRAAVDYTEPSIAINADTVNAVYSAGDVVELHFTITNGTTGYETAYVEIYEGMQVRPSALVGSSNHVRTAGSSALSEVDWSLTWDTLGCSPGVYTVVAYMKLPAEVYLGQVTQYYSRHISEVSTSVTLTVAINPPTENKGIVYNGDAQIGVDEGDGYVVTGGVAKMAGYYTATATLRSGYMWSDGTTEPKTISWCIAKAPQKISAKNVSASVKANKSGKTKKLAKDVAVNLKKKAKVSAKTKVTYKKANKAGGKLIAVNKKTGKVTLKKGLKAGAYKVKVKLTAPKNKNYKAAKAKYVTLTVKVK